MFVSRSKAEQLDFPLTQPTWPQHAAVPKKLMWMAESESFPFPPTQPRAPATTKVSSNTENNNHWWWPLSTRQRLNPVHVNINEQMRWATLHCGYCQCCDWHYTLQTPVWPDDDSSNEEEHETASDDRIQVDSLMDDIDDDADRVPPSHSGGPRLVQTDAGKLKLMDQDIDTHRMVQRAILEAKVHMTFVTGYPDLTEKSVFTRNTLLEAGRTCGVLPIQNRLKTDDSYVSALAPLVCREVHTRVLVTNLVACRLKLVYHFFALNWRTTLVHKWQPTIVSALIVSTPRRLWWWTTFTIFHSILM